MQPRLIAFWFLIGCALILFSAVGQAQPAHNLDSTSRIQVLESQQIALRLLKQYNYALEQAGAKGEILLVDDKLGYRVSVTRLQLKELLTALQKLDRTGVSPSRLGFFQMPISGDIDKMIAAFEAVSQRAVERSVKPALTNIAKLMSANEHELATLRADGSKRPDTTKQRWLLQPTKLNPDSLPLKTAERGRQSHVYEKSAELGTNSFVWTARHLFQDKPATYDYTCSFTFTDPPAQIQPGSNFDLTISGSCRANSGFNIGKMTLKLKSKGRNIKPLPSASGEDPPIDSLVVGESLSQKKSSDQHIFTFRVDDAEPARGAIVQLQLEAEGWGRLLTWSWKFGEEAIR